MGYDVKLLNEANITEDNLKQFDAVIAGVRAYNVNDWLTGKYNILMHYVHNGGNYIVQYNTSNFVSTVSSKIGPYPFTISRTRVTDENAAVNILLPNTPALNTPNKITPKDFEGWVQERSIYQAEKPDSNYIAPFGMHDAKETETNGSPHYSQIRQRKLCIYRACIFQGVARGRTGAYKLLLTWLGCQK